MKFCKYQMLPPKHLIFTEFHSGVSTEYEYELDEEGYVAKMIQKRSSPYSTNMYNSTDPFKKDETLIITYVE